MVSRWGKGCICAAVAAMTAAGFTACSTPAATQVMGSWRDDAYHGTLGKVLVLSRAEEPGIRELAERTLAGELKARKVDAVPSTDLMPAAEPVNRDTVRRAIAGKGFATVLVTRLIGVDLKRGYVPPDPTQSIFGAGPTVSMTPGYDYRQPELFIQIALYETPHGQLVWSMTTKNRNRGTVPDVVQSYSNAVVRTLAAQGLL